MQSFYADRFKKRKKTVKESFLGSLCIKAARNVLMKLTAGQQKSNQKR